MRALRPDIADWSNETEMLARLLEATVNIHARPTTPYRVTRPGEIREEVPRMATVDEMKTFFGSAVRVVPAA